MPDEIGGEVDYFIVQLAVIFLPGLIWERIETHYALKNLPTQFDVIIRVFVFGLVSYLLTFGLYRVAGLNFDIVEPTKDKTFLSIGVVDELIAATLVAFISSILWLYSCKYKLVPRFLQQIGATKKYGDEDVWDYTFNSDDARVEYVYVRDYENEKVFTGWVVAFSETGKVRELTLRDVQTFDLQGNLLYEIPLMYIGRPIDGIHIEFPYKG